MFLSQREPAAVEYRLVLLPADSGALCLDGSPGGYYWSPGTGVNASRWIVHMEGGAWCLDQADCLKRSKSAIGSSSSWKPTMNGVPGMDGGANGMLSSDATVNPDFYDWTKVHLNYCDGASFSGDLSEPHTMESGEELYFRGRKILDASLASLIEKGLDSAMNVIWKGCSAGGLGTYLHTDYVMQRLPTTVDFVAVGDAGMFLDLPRWTGEEGYPAHFRHIAGMQNVSALNDACLMQYQDGESWRCFMAPYVLPYIQTPLFIVQALYDSWQSSNIVGLDCVADACTNQTEYDAWLHMGTEMKTVLAKAPAGSGVFATPCHIHGQVNLNKFWTGLKVNGITMRDAFGQWWRTRTDLNLVDDGPFGSNDC